MLDDIAPIEKVSAFSPRRRLIHVTADTHVNSGNSEDLFAAAGEPKLILLPGIEHGMGMKGVPDEYTDLIVRLFDLHLD